MYDVSKPHTDKIPWSCLDGFTDIPAATECLRNPNNVHLLEVKGTF